MTNRLHDYFQGMLLLLVAFSTHDLLLAQRHYYVSTNGLDTNNGSLSQPFRQLSTACKNAGPGDTIYIMPGTYTGINKLINIHGKPNLPISIVAQDPDQIPVFDGEASPSNTAFNPGIALEDCSWINISGIKFENCWNSVIDVKESSYISVQFCHFTTGKWVVHPHGLGTHHVLVENCIVHHPPQVWKGWSWLEIHHGELEHYNGALLHPRKSAGGHVMRNNELRNLFNGFRTRPATIKEDGNTEIYGNKIYNIRDNEFEPESWAWNMYYYQNDHVNVHKLFSIDGVEGGNIYIYGNTYTQANDPWTNYQVSGIYKYKGGPLTFPCYVFNNSFYTTGRVMKYGESSNHMMKHFNNAYQFFAREKAFRVVDWQPGYEFDYDLINQNWSENILKYNQEQNGLSNTLAGFDNPQEGSFSLLPSSAGIDRGKVMNFPALGWRQSYTGAAPDIGAFEGNRRVEGPPFRFVPSPEGAYYEEYPRVTRHYIKDNFLLVHLSTPLKQIDLEGKIKLFDDGSPVDVESITLFEDGLTVLISCQAAIDGAVLTWDFDSDILGANGLPLVSWASTIPPRSGRKSIPNIHFGDPWSSELPEVKRVDMSHEINTEEKLTVEMVVDPALPIVYRGILGLFTEDDVYLDGAYPEYTSSGAIYTMDAAKLKPGKYHLVLLVAGRIFRKEILIP